MRQEALDMVHEYTLTGPLWKHTLAVESGLNAYARRWDHDEELWSVAGLLHDFDYERFPSYPGHLM